MSMTGPGRTVKTNAKSLAANESHAMTFKPTPGLKEKIFGSFGSSPASPEPHCGAVPWLQRNVDPLLQVNITKWALLFRSVSSLACASSHRPRTLRTTVPSLLCLSKREM